MGVGVGTGIGVGVGMGVGVGIAVAMGVGMGSGVGVLVGTGESVAVAVGDTVGSIVSAGAGVAPGAVGSGSQATIAAANNTKSTIPRIPLRSIMFCSCQLGRIGKARRTPLYDCPGLTTSRRTVSTLQALVLQFR